MAGIVLRRSARLATTATACQPEQVLTLKRARATASFSTKSGGAKKKNTGKKGDALSVKCVQNDAGNSQENISEDLESQENLPAAPLKSQKQKKILDKQARILQRVPSRDLEAELWKTGFKHVAGVDEAGRGPLAGPVVAAACIIPSSITIEGIDDSKKLSEIRREELYKKLTSTPGINYAVHIIDAGTIDEVNILQATMQAMAACVEKLSSAANGHPCPDFILVDGNRLPVDFPEEKARSVVKGDSICHVIAAASILAKVTRDRLMVNYDKQWPVYGFKCHKGYGTAAHIAALLKHGPCDIHRWSFAPLKDQGIVSVNDLEVMAFRAHEGRKPGVQNAPPSNSEYISVYVVFSSQSVVFGPYRITFTPVPGFFLSWLQ